MNIYIYFFPETIFTATVLPQKASIAIAILDQKTLHWQLTKVIPWYA